MENIIIATIKEWNIKNAKLLIENLKEIYNIVLLTKKEELNIEYLKEINPKYVFFPHWSWIIPKDIYENYECIVFHTADLPYGRGGSPLQNQIIRKIYNTKISAIKVVKDLDAGDVYFKKNISLKIGNIEEIFMEMSKKIFFEMIPKILKERPAPKPQIGEILEFKRRKPEDSNFEKTDFETLESIYDFIRMVDGEGYPKAFIKKGNFKLEFSEVNYKDGKLVGRFEINEE